MEEGFTIDVAYGGEVLSFAVMLAATGYTHKFYVQINDIEVIYEPDEERNYRAIVNDTIVAKLTQRDTELIKAIAEQLNLLHQ